jgi:hypothetical protein
MRGSLRNWPKLLGGVVALEAFGLALWQAGYVAHGYIGILEGFVLAVALLLGVFSAGLFCAHNWARWCVIAFGGLFSAALIVITVMSVSHNVIRRSEFERHATLGELGVDDWLRVLPEVGVSVCLLAPIALVVCVLCHHDVAATFSRGTAKRSNQAMQRTAPRSDA